MIDERPDVIFVDRAGLAVGRAASVGVAADEHQPMQRAALGRTAATRDEMDAEQPGSALDLDPLASHQMTDARHHAPSVFRRCGQ
jgi:hypothetical protein